MASADRIPDATVARLPVYLRSLLDLDRRGVTTVSSDVLADLAGVNAAKVRKDLSHLGTYGTRGVGYDVAYLCFQMSRALGVAHAWPVVVVGLGNLGRALVNRGFADRGFPVVAAIDVDAAKIGTVVDGVPVVDPDDLGRLVADRGVAVGVIAVPAGAAQEVADRLVAAGIRAVLSMAATVLTVPDDVAVRTVDLATELQILGFHLSQAQRGVGNGTGAPTGWEPPASAL